MQLPFKIILFSALAGFAPTVRAQVEAPQDNGYVGALLGLAKHQDYSARLGYGAEVGVHLANRFGLGAEFVASNGSNTIVMTYGATLDYNLRDSAPGLAIGVLIGAVTTSTDLPKTSITQTKFMVGPRIAYDFFVADNFSLGANIAVPVVRDETTQVSFLALGGAKYWF